MGLIPFTRAIYFSKRPPMFLAGSLVERIGCVSVFPMNPSIYFRNCCYFPWLVLVGIHHYWRFAFSRAVSNCKETDGFSRRSHKTQLPSGALFPFVWQGFPFKVNQTKKDARFFPMATGHLRRGPGQIHPRPVRSHGACDGAAA